MTGEGSALCSRWSWERNSYYGKRSTNRITSAAPLVAPHRLSLWRTHFVVGPRVLFGHEQLGAQVVHPAARQHGNECEGHGGRREHFAFLGGDVEWLQGRDHWHRAASQREGSPFALQPHGHHQGEHQRERSDAGIAGGESCHDGGREE